MNVVDRFSVYCKIGTKRLKMRSAFSLRSLLIRRKTSIVITSTAKGATEAQEARTNILPMIDAAEETIAR